MVLCFLLKTATTPPYFMPSTSRLCSMRKDRRTLKSIFKLLQDVSCNSYVVCIFTHFKCGDQGECVEEVCDTAGIRLASGTYHVSPTVGNQAHLYMQCYNERVDIFEVDFSGVFFYFTVCLTTTRCMHPSVLPSQKDFRTYPCSL